MGVSPQSEIFGSKTSAFPPASFQIVMWKDDDIKVELKDYVGGTRKYLKSTFPISWEQHVK